MRAKIASMLLLLFLALPSPARAAELEIMEYADLLGYVAANKGKVVLVNFWATWCAPCRIEIPHLKRIREEFPQDELAMAGVSLDMGEEVVERFLEANSFNYPIFLGASSVASGFRVTAVPRTIVYNEQGVRVFSREGLVESDDLKALIASLLKD